MFEEDSVISLLIDLDAGTLSVFKNGRRLGIMKSGLSGEYCWMLALGKGGVYGSAFRIETGPIPVV